MLKIFSKLKSFKQEYIKINEIKIAASLNLLKENALKADFKVELLSPQKLIKKKKLILSVLNQKKKQLSYQNLLKLSY